MLFLLSISDRDLSDAEILDTAMCRGSAAGLGLTSATNSATSPQQQQQPSTSLTDASDESSTVHDTEVASSASLGGGQGDEEIGQRGVFPRSSLPGSTSNSATSSASSMTAVASTVSVPGTSHGRSVVGAITGVSHRGARRSWRGRGRGLLGGLYFVLFLSLSLYACVQRLSWGGHFNHFFVLLCIELLYLSELLFFFPFVWHNIRVILLLTFLLTFLAQ